MIIHLCTYTLIDPITFQLESNNDGNMYFINLYNNSIVNNDIEGTNITIHCKSIFGSGDLKFSSDNNILNEYFSAENFDTPLSVGGAANIVVNQSINYDLSLSIEFYDCAIDGNITCYSQESGESTTVLLTCGEL